jgi:hypothetical protein
MPSNRDPTPLNPPQAAIHLILQVVQGWRQMQTKVKPLISTPARHCSGRRKNGLKMTEINLHELKAAFLLSSISRIACSRAGYCQTVRLVQ